MAVDLTCTTGPLSDALFVILVARYETLTVTDQQKVDAALQVRLEVIREEKRQRAEARYYRPSADPEWDRAEAQRRTRDLGHWEPGAPF